MLQRQEILPPAERERVFMCFWFRSVIGSYFSAWKLERSRLQRKGLSFWGMNNEMIWYTILPILFAVILTFGTSVYFERIVWEVPLFFFAQSLLAFTLLEIVNYVEHYGIVRKEKSPGVYESVNPMHSWNSNHRLSNFFPIPASAALRPPCKCHKKVSST